MASKKTGKANAKKATKKNIKHISARMRDAQLAKQLGLSQREVPSFSRSTK